MKVRSVIRAEKGNVLVSCDLAQAETWIVASLANEENMKHALKFDDIHATTAKAIFEIPDFYFENRLVGPKEMYKVFKLITDEQRYSGKRTNHSTSYMMGPYEFVRRYNEEADTPIYFSVAKQYQEAWHELYPGVKGWWTRTEHELLRNNGTLVTPYGRRIQFFGPINLYIKDAIACVPQSTVADHFRGREQKHNEIPGGLRDINKRLPRDARICQQGHDSALVECPTGIAMDVVHIMKTCLHRPLIVNGEEVLIPVDAEIGENWGEMEKVKWT